MATKTSHAHAGSGASGTLIRETEPGLANTHVQTLHRRKATRVAGQYPEPNRQRGGGDHQVVWGDRAAGGRAFGNEAAVGAGGRQVQWLDWESGKNSLDLRLPPPAARGVRDRRGGRRGATRPQ